MKSLCVLTLNFVNLVVMDCSGIFLSIYYFHESVLTRITGSGSRYRSSSLARPSLYSSRWVTPIRGQISC